MNLRRGTVWGVLAAQLWAAGLTGIAHTREALDAPVRIESTTHERCPVLHDPSSCAVCSYSHTRAVVTARAITIVPLPQPIPAWQQTIDHVVFVPLHHATAPRGPPPALI
jgi:hypothetical protein